jgi:hypothetical protein
MSEALSTIVEEFPVESTVTFPSPDEGLTEAPADGIVGTDFSITKEQASEFYYQLSLRMPPHQFACVPHPIHVESDPRLFEIYNKVLGGTNRTNEIQVEYHRLCKEDPEHIREHYRWYQSTLKLEPVPFADVESNVISEEEEKRAVTSLMASLSFLTASAKDGDGDTEIDAGKSDGESSI